MHEHQTPPTSQDITKTPTAPAPPGTGFLSGLTFPGAAAPVPKPAAPAAPPPQARKIFSRYVLPMLILIGGIGGIAWVTQYLPSRVKPNDLPTTEKLTLTFAQDRVLPGEEQNWKTGEKQQRPLPEFEVVTNGRQDRGFADFEFKNNNTKPVEVGVQETNCGCSRVRIGLGDDRQWDAYQRRKALTDNPAHGHGEDDTLTWTEVKKDVPHAVLVAPGQQGVLRLFWDGRNETPGHLDLRAVVWVQPKDVPQSRTPRPLQVVVTYVDAVRCFPDKLPPVYLKAASDQQEFTFYCWSATRDFTAKESQPDPLMPLTITPQKGDELRTLEDTLRKGGIQTQVRSAYKVQGKLYREKDGKELDLGAFKRQPMLAFASGAEDLAKVTVPAVTGAVRGDVKVNDSYEQMQIDLGSFAADRGRPKLVVTVWTRGKIALNPTASFEPALPGVTATVEKTTEGSNDAGTAWKVTFTFGGGLPTGPLQDTVVVLTRSDSERRIRIPVMGHFHK